MRKVLLLSAIILFQYTTALAQFSGGSGSEIDPYQVSTLEQLQEIQNHTDKHFIQINDIDASETVNWNEDKGFTPIGDDLIPFSGSFNGKNHQVVDLYINNENNYIGLFGYIENGVIENINLKDADVTGGSYTGSLVGWNENGVVKNSTTSGNIKGNVGVGGLVGHNFFGAEIISTQSNVIVYGYDNVGGLVGNNWADLFDSFSNGEVHIENQLNYGSAGGLVGNNTVLILSSYSGSTVNGQEEVGGLSGINSGTIKQSYSTGLVNGVQDVGGFVGSNGGDIEFSYWDSENNGNYNGVGRGYEEGVTGLTSEQMTGKSAEQNMPDLTFGETWGSIPSEYPKLLWSIPYFQIASITTNEPIIEGEQLNVDLTINNIGGLADTQSVVLKNATDDTLDSSPGPLLESGQTETVSLHWQSAVGDEGAYTFTVESEYDRKSFDFNVRTIPATVELTSPTNQQDDVSLLPVLTWNQAELATNYHLQLSKLSNPDFTSPELDIETVADTSYQVINDLDSGETYVWRVRAGNDAGFSEWSESLQFSTELTTSIDEHNGLPDKVSLNQNYPNPFNPTTTVSFTLPESSDVSVEVFNSLGQRVAELVNEIKSAGVHRVSFDASSLSSGIYLIRMSTPEQTFTRKMTLIK